MPYPLKRNLLEVPFAVGWLHYQELFAYIGHEAASTALARIIDYTSPDFNQHMTSLAQIAVSYEVNPNENKTVEGIIIAVGVQVHQQMTAFQLFKTNSPKQCPYELHAIATERLLLREVDYGVHLPKLGA